MNYFWIMYFCFKNKKKLSSKLTLLNLIGYIFLWRQIIAKAFIQRNSIPVYIKC